MTVRTRLRNQSILVRFPSRVQVTVLVTPRTRDGSVAARCVCTTVRPHRAGSGFGATPWQRGTGRPSHPQRSSVSAPTGLSLYACAVRITHPTALEIKPRSGPARPHASCTDAPVVDDKSATPHPTHKVKTRRKAHDSGSLVDPASSDSLVSKISSHARLSMSEPRPSETADGSLHQFEFTRWMCESATWISVVILELIHAGAPVRGLYLLDVKTDSLRGDAFVDSR